MINIFIAFFCLLPFAPFLFTSVDLWHATGQFVQLGILVLFCYSFFEKPREVKIFNKPLGIFVLWAGLTTGYWWIKGLALTKTYPIKIFMPFFNVLCLVLLYKLIIEYLDAEKINKVLKWFKYSVLLLLIYCALQYFNLDQFLKNTNQSSNDCLVGTIGNQTHLAGLLAILQPLFFNRRDILVLVLLWLIIFLTGSASGLICGVLVLLFWLFFKFRKSFWWLLGFCSVGAIPFFIYGKEFLTSSGRFEMWGKVFELFKAQPIMGSGIGTFGANKLYQLGTWQHLHNEYYQVAFELGLIGLVLVAWCIWDYFKSFKELKTDSTIRLASIFFGFCSLSLINFVGHLWQISVIALFAYAGIYVIKNEVAN